MSTSTNIIIASEISKHATHLGAKTLNLKKCLDWGFVVPNFIALPSYLSEKLLVDTALRDTVANQSTATLGQHTYVVRSSALIEDSANESFAGQFLTKTNLSAQEVSEAIFEVLSQAKVFLDGKLDQFSIIIQEYIVADFSGIAFTRNPNGGREMIVEYGFCQGEKLVSGQIQPTKKSFYWNNPEVSGFPRSFRQNSIIDNFKKMEDKMGFPQDIEWCIKNERFYILQTRPITTLSKDQYDQAKWLDTVMPADSAYYLDKTELSEIAPRPTPITLSLLNKIYASDGPVSSVYKRYGIKYQDTQFLKIVGNELYVDKEKEIQGILPSFSYLKNARFQPKISFDRHLVSTIKNSYNLNRISTKKFDRLFKELKTKIQSEPTTADIKSISARFLSDYELIFEINLLTGLATKKVTNVLKNQPVQLSELLNNSLQLIELSSYKIEAPRGLQGNSLELFDDSTFVDSLSNKTTPTKKLTDWWHGVPAYRQTFLKKYIAEAIIYSRLREYGRWLTVKNISTLRLALLKVAQQKKFLAESNIYFSSLDTVLADSVDENACQKIRSAYDTYNQFNLPSKLTSSVLTTENQAQGVSTGIATGILLTKDTLDQQVTSGQKIILYTEILSPNLSQYFDRIAGIVSHNGGLLSHLAIIAREQHIPVIVGHSLAQQRNNLGQLVQINGNTGEIITTTEV